MASEETLALAEHYLHSYAVPEERFGLGSLLESGSYSLFASRMAKLDGSMRLAIDAGAFWDCRSIAETIYSAILREHPELQPRIAMFDTHGIHNWVEIIDPKTGEIIQ